jgi:hypothetical protein
VQHPPVDSVPALPPATPAPAPATAPAKPPEPVDPTLRTIRTKEAAELRDAFDASKGLPRYVVALSPTDPSCLRGASALGKALAEHPRAQARVYVVWFPVVKSDLGPPSAAARAPLRDPRVLEFWDPDRRVSPRMIDRALKLARAKGETPDFDEGAIAWDVIAFLPEATVWEEPFPTPLWTDAPVEQAIPRVKRLFVSGSRRVD